MKVRSAPDELFSQFSAPLRGEAVAPSDKSISHRALILGSMATGETEILGLLESEDVLRTAKAIQAFGARAMRKAPGHWLVQGAEWRSPNNIIDCGNAGTTVRLLMGAAAGFPLTVRFDGDDSLRRRPMGRVIDPLVRMGACFESGRELPLVVSGGALKGLSYENPHPSAQVKSAILLAGLRANGRVEVIEPTPSRDHSERMLGAFGVAVEVKEVRRGRRVRLNGSRRLCAASVKVPGDPSSAAFPLVAALLVPGSEVTMRGVLVNRLRAGLFTVLRSMGADLSIFGETEVGGEPVADLTAKASLLSGVEVAPEMAPSMIDEYPILAVAAACASGTTTMHGLGELRVKESDRLAAVTAGLRMCGVQVETKGDSLIVHGCGDPPRGGARIETNGDHRIGMAFLVLGLVSQRPVTVIGASTIDTSFPNFADVMRTLGAEVQGR